MCIRDRCFKIHASYLTGIEIPGADVKRALVEAFTSVAVNKLGVKLLLKTQSRTLGTGAERRIERKQARLYLADRYVAVGTSVLGGKSLFLSVKVDYDKPVRQFKRGFHAVGKAFFYARFHDKTVHDYAYAVRCV